MEPKLFNPKLGTYCTLIEQTCSEPAGCTGCIAYVTLNPSEES